MTICHVCSWLPLTEQFETEKETAKRRLSAQMLKKDVRKNAGVFQTDYKLVRLRGAGCEACDPKLLRAFN